MTTTAHTPRRFRATDNSPAAQAWRNVPHNPHPLCRDFTPKPEPAAYWCATCGWNQPMHADEEKRNAIAAELEHLAASSGSPVGARENGGTR